jgi:hypothetical protein
MEVVDFIDAKAIYLSAHFHPFDWDALDKTLPKESSELREELWGQLDPQINHLIKTA